MALQYEKCKTIVRLEESNIEKLKIKTEYKGRVKLEKALNRFHTYCWGRVVCFQKYIYFKKKVGTSIFPPTQ